jgi:hypothetical protein
VAANAAKERAAEERVAAENANEAERVATAD